jgi:hypothetical protein
MAARIEGLMREEGRARSELLREALRRYVKENRLRMLSQEISEKDREARVASAAEGRVQHLATGDKGIQQLASI